MSSRFAAKSDPFRLVLHSQDGDGGRVRCELGLKGCWPILAGEHVAWPSSHRTLRGETGLHRFQAINCLATIFESLRDSCRPAHHFNTPILWYSTRPESRTRTACPTLASRLARRSVKEPKRQGEVGSFRRRWRSRALPIGHYHLRCCTGAGNDFSLGRRLAHPH